MEPSWSLWSDMLPSAIKLPLTLYKHRFTLQFAYKKVSVWLNTGTSDILILGRASVGKSILSDNLNGKVNLHYTPRGISDDVERDAIKLGKWFKMVKVVPGQDSSERYNAKNKELIQNDNLSGIIYVVDWGYTIDRNGAVRRKQIEDGIDNVEKLRIYNLQRELADFKQMLEEIKITKASGGGPGWVVVAVNKIDLFMDKIDDAERYYNPVFDSDFTKLCKEFVTSVGSQNIKLLTLPICCWTENIEWNGSEIKSNIGGRQKEQDYFKLFLNEINKLEK